MSTLLTFLVNTNTLCRPEAKRALTMVRPTAPVPPTTATTTMMDLQEVIELDVVNGNQKMIVSILNESSKEGCSILATTHTAWGSLLTARQ